MDLVVKAGTLVAIIALGYLVKRLGWLRGEDFRVLSTIALRITLPCALIVSFDSFEITPSLLWLSVFAFVVVCGGQVVTWIVERRRGPGAQAFGVLNVSSFNIGLFVIPYLGVFLGPQAVVIASMFDVGNALAALSKLDREDRLFSRDIVAVDMRLPDRLTVQLSEDAARAREDLFKEKKPKKKAGDA